MIKKITIRDVASYDSEGVVLDDLQKVNFVFGGNGTGKTTLSRVLGSENRELEYPGCEVKWRGKQKKVLVYNKDFKERNVKEKLPGVFMLGEISISLNDELVEILDRMKSEREMKRTSTINLIKAKRELAKEKTLQKDKLWAEVYEKYRYFERCFEDSITKVTFADRLTEEVETWKLVDLADYKRFALDLDELKGRYQYLYGGEYSELSEEDPDSEGILSARGILTKDLWSHIAMESRALLGEMKERINGLENEVLLMEEKLASTKLALEGLETSLVKALDMVKSVRPSMERMNDMLEGIGATGFSIQMSPMYQGYYELRRDDGTSVNNTLSEGETSLITFLYFMELVNGRKMMDSQPDNRVVVIDDPISSLDGDLLIEVNRMVRKLTDEVLAGESNIDQLFVLTHNTEFHRLLSQRKRNNDVHYYKLMKQWGVSALLSYGIENPVKSDYEMQWEQLRLLKNGYRIPDAPNAMRKILEAYFVRLGGYEKRDLALKTFPNDKVKRELVESLLKWMDEGSHGVSDGLYIGDMESVSWKYLEVFRMVFEKLGHLAHYEMMMTERP